MSRAFSRHKHCLTIVKRWYGRSVVRFCFINWKNLQKTFKNFQLYFTIITHGYKLATKWSCWLENKYETFSLRENHWNFFPGWKTLTYSWRLWDSNPRPASNSVVVITPTCRLVHHLNHSATELWYCFLEIRIAKVWNVLFLKYLIFLFGLCFLIS